MATVKIKIANGKKTIAPVIVDNNIITHVGIHPRKNPIGWSRLYQHLWKQAIKSSGFSSDDANNLEKWVLAKLGVFKPYCNRINPDNINYEDVKDILSKYGDNKIDLSDFIPFDPNLKHESFTDIDFYNHDKYKDFFDKPGDIPTLDGGFKGWWKIVDSDFTFQPETQDTQNDNQSDTSSDNQTGESNTDQNIQETDSETQSYYGGYELQYGDKDSDKKWGGAVRTESGSHVEDMQKDLVRLGYWVSDPTSDNDSYGMKTDGIFLDLTKGAVYLFQREHEISPANGIVSSSTAGKIKEKVAGLTTNQKYQRPSIVITGTYAGTYYELPPSSNFIKTEPYYGSSPTYKYLRDTWGQKALVDAIPKAASDWLEADSNHSKIMVGDLSQDDGTGVPYSGGVHHGYGQGADIQNDPYCDIKSNEFNKEKAVELARIFKNNGVKHILFYCKYVKDQLEDGFIIDYEGHDNHFHLAVNPFTNSIRGHLCENCEQKVTKTAEAERQALDDEWKKLTDSWNEDQKNNYPSQEDKDSYTKAHSLKCFYEDRQ